MGLFSSHTCDNKTRYLTPKHDLFPNLTKCFFEPKCNQSIAKFPQPNGPTGLGKKRLPFLSSRLGLGLMVKLVRVREETGAPDLAKSYIPSVVNCYWILGWVYLATKLGEWGIKYVGTQACSCHDKTENWT